MKILAQWLRSAAVVNAIVLICSARSASANTYTIYDLGDSNARGIYGMSTTGAVVIFQQSCGVFGPSCYVTYANGLAVGNSSTAPGLAYDDGTPCSSTPAGFNAAKKTCNNGLVGMGSLYNPNGDPNGVYIGSGNAFQLLHGGSADQVFLNASGNFAWTDGNNEEIFEAVDTSRSTATPEPGTWLLVGTGFLLFTAALRRKALR
jgi:peptidoglycan hydrolase-like protein with peptidoglycan-binding domain